MPRKPKLPKRCVTVRVEDDRITPAKLRSDGWTLNDAVATWILRWDDDREFQLCHNLEQFDIGNSYGSEAIRPVKGLRDLRELVRVLRGESQ